MKIIEQFMYHDELIAVGVFLILGNSYDAAWNLFFEDLPDCCLWWSDELEFIATLKRLYLYFLLHVRLKKNNSNLSFVDVFQSALKFGTFSAVMLTYAASALLHVSNKAVTLSAAFL